MKAAARNAKIETPGRTDQLHQLAFALLCGTALFYWQRWFLRTRGVAADCSPRICWCVRAICVRCVFRKSPLTRYDYRPFQGVHWRSAYRLRRSGIPTKFMTPAASASTIAGSAFYCAQYFLVSSARINASEGRFIYLARGKILTWPDYVKNSNCRAFICVKDPAATTRPEVTATSSVYQHVDSRGLKALKRALISGLPVSGERIVRKDRYGRVIEDISSDSQAARNTALSIDAYRRWFTRANNAVAFNKASRWRGAGRCQYR